MTLAFIEITICISLNISRTKFVEGERLASFINPIRYVRFKIRFAVITSLPELNLRHSIFIPLKKGDFYKQWQQYMKLKTMEISKAWADIFAETDRYT